MFLSPSWIVDLWLQLRHDLQHSKNSCCKLSLKRLNIVYLVEKFEKVMEQNLWQQDPELH